MTNKKYDLIIIGTGPGALTAGIYATRYKMDTLVIGQTPGGYVSSTQEIINYPGFEKISGMELTQKLIEQTKKLGAEIIHGVVGKIKKTKKGFEVKTKKEIYLGKKIILATGRERRQLGLIKEKEFLGKGVSYCATCDAGFYKNKIVGVVGGGNSALTATLLVARYAKKVYIFYRKDKFFRAEPVWVEDVEKAKNIEVVFNSEVRELIGKERLEKIKLKDGKEFKLDGLFIEVGSTPNTKLAQELGLELENGEIKVDKNKKTNVEGVYAVGDVTNTPLKQIITAAGDGAIASFNVYKELRG